MRRADTQADPDARFATLLDAHGAPPCDPPDACPVCLLFTGQRPGEDRSAWLTRITGYSPINALETAS